MKTKIMNFANIWIYMVVAISLFFTACLGNQEKTNLSEQENTLAYTLEILASSLHEASSADIKEKAASGSAIDLMAESWMAFYADFEEAGRYNVSVVVKNMGDIPAKVWIEDYYDNPDDRTYDVTGEIEVPVSTETQSLGVDGSPFNQGNHPMKFHVLEGEVSIEKVVFTLMASHQVSEKVLEQTMDGEQWELVWSDEFDGDQVDESKWTYDLGDWGWGNNELQYYTVNRPENARIENGNLILEARKNDFGQEWTSARLTTRGKVAFLYGKIEFRAKVPRLKGNWAAGWTLGNTYVDEKDWPYCGEIDILESVGYEVDNETGDGIAHATVHTPAYYFKINNQISSQKAIPNMAGEFHTYAVEWTPTEIKMLVNDEVYYTYDKIANEKEWPFHIPQNIILNLAIGGGWGGSQGLDPDMTTQEFILDYVRVYEKR